MNRFIALVVALLFLAGLAAFAPGAAPALAAPGPEEHPPQLMRWVQIVRKSEGGTWWRDVAGFHIRGVRQSATYGGDLVGDLSLLYNADVQPNGDGRAYGDVVIRLSGYADLFEGTFAYKISRGIVIDGEMMASNGHGLTLVATHIRQGSSGRVLLLDGYMTVEPDH